MSEANGPSVNEVNGLSVSVTSGPSVNEVNGLTVSVTSGPSVNEVNGPSVSVTNGLKNKNHVLLTCNISNFLPSFGSY